MKNFEKEIWYLFKLNRSEINRAERKIERVLQNVFEQGKTCGKKEYKKTLMRLLK
jgi:predicted patatin/cPLA2 family phospholipase